MKSTRNDPKAVRLRQFPSLSVAKRRFFRFPSLFYGGEGGATGFFGRRRQGGALTQFRALVWETCRGKRCHATAVQHRGGRDGLAASNYCKTPPLTAFLGTNHYPAYA